MIVLRRSGTYTLGETAGGTKLLYLDGTEYAWVEPLAFGALLVLSRYNPKPKLLLSAGKYRLYTVADEPGLVDEPHLELEVGNGQWQGYLLPVGLPDRAQIRRRIIATDECITHHVTSRALMRAYPGPSTRQLIGAKNKQVDMVAHR
ncbi:MAG TPA: hypothetical protein VLF69_05260 [Candidatus Saccharimonadales bacterium]|nr:hypothetical protein [Candidatus Saccharimonadales bacterium]